MFFFGFVCTERRWSRGTVGVCDNGVVVVSLWCMGFWWVGGTTGWGQGRDRKKSYPESLLLQLCTEMKPTEYLFSPTSHKKNTSTKERPSFSNFIKNLGGRRKREKKKSETFGPPPFPRLPVWLTTPPSTFLASFTLQAISLRGSHPSGLHLQAQRWSRSAWAKVGRAQDDKDSGPKSVWAEVGGHPWVRRERGQPDPSGDTLLFPNFAFKEGCPGVPFFTLGGRGFQRSPSGCTRLFFSNSL